MIRYSELQIGDYVLVEGKVRRVESLTKRKIGFHINEEKKRLYYARLCEVFPIEINDYILRTSGFCMDVTERSTMATFEDDNVRLDVIYTKGDELWVVSEKNKGTYDACIVSLRYVHQLQHAIRLCGINFEVKL